MTHGGGDIPTGEEVLVFIIIITATLVTAKLLDFSKNFLGTPSLEVIQWAQLTYLIQLVISSLHRSYYGANPYYTKRLQSTM